MSTGRNGRKDGDRMRTPPDHLGQVAGVAWQVEAGGT